MLPALLLLFPLFATCTQALTYRGADFSSVAVLERQGITYKEGGTVRPLETILKNNGLNTARIRIWTAGDYTLNYGLALAKRIKAAGLTLIVDLHFSDTWADPGKQAIPSGWPTNLSGLNTRVWEYTRDLVAAFSNQGTPIDILQVGNEVNDGLLWPVGKISTNGFSPASQLLHSAISGAKVSKSDIKILIHIANGWNWGGVSWFFNGIFTQGALALSEVDLIGFSMYPFYETSATLANLRSSLSQFVSRWNKDIIVAETDWPASCPGRTMTEPSIPVSAAGQEQWVRSIRDVLSGLSNGRGKGILYWEPAWIGNAGLGSACADAILVDNSGNTRSSIRMFSTAM